MVTLRLKEKKRCRKTHFYISQTVEKVGQPQADNNNKAFPFEGKGDRLRWMRCYITENFSRIKRGCSKTIFKIGLTTALLFCLKTRNPSKII